GARARALPAPRRAGPLPRLRGPAARLPPDRPPHDDAPRARDRELLPDHVAVRGLRGAPARRVRPRGLRGGRARLHARGRARALRRRGVLRVSYVHRGRGRRARRGRGSPLMAVTVKPGTTIGEYTVVKKLGEGGMGEVYLAVHQKLGQQVVLKGLHKQL